MCKLVKFSQVFVLYGSSYVLVSTALDRYIAICHPMRSHSWTAASAHRLVAVAWITAGVFAIPQLVIFDFVELAPAGSGVYDCWGHFEPDWTLPLYITWFAAAVYVVPLLCLAVIYIRICSVVWRSAAAAPPTPHFPSVSATSVVVVGDAQPKPHSVTASVLWSANENSINDRCLTDIDTDATSVHSMSLSLIHI